jgi:hypothetical protein
MRRVLIGLLFTIISSPINAGPFGLERGMPLSSLRIIKKNGPISYIVAVPSPIDAFERYNVIATESAGVCKISAMGRDVDSDAYGYSIKQKYEELKATLIKKYGDPKTYEFLQFKSIWDEPRDWSMSIYKKERVHSSFWSKNVGSTTPDGMTGIILEINSVESGTNYLSLMYEFDNFLQCKSQVSSMEEKAL